MSEGNCREQAELEYELFLERNFLKRDFSVDEAERRDSEMDKQIIVAAIMRGALVIDENGIPTYTPETSDNRDPVTFYKPKGDVLAAMDKRKEHQKISQMFAAMGQLTRTSAVKFSKMDHRPDLEVCMTLFSAFLA